MSLPKGVAQTISFPLLDSNGDGITGAILTASISKDGNTFVSCTNAVSEVSGGGGQYKITLTATERNADEIVIAATDGTYGTKVHHYPGLNLQDGTAQLSIKSLSVVNDAGDAVVLGSSGSNGRGLYTYGNGSGAGFATNGGATGSGLKTSGGATSGHGIFSTATASGQGVYAQGAGSGAGLLSIGGSVGDGISASGGTNKSGINTTGNGSGHGIYAVAGNTGGGLTAHGNTTGIGLKLVGGATSGDALNISATSGNTEVSISQAAADKVWSSASRTLSSFGTLISDIWASVTDSSGVTSLLSRIGSVLTISNGKVTVGTNDDKTGYELTSSERTAIANEVEAQIIDDTDSERVLQAIVDKIAETNPSLDDLTLSSISAAVRTEIERAGGMLDGKMNTFSYVEPDNAGIAANGAAIAQIPDPDYTAVNLTRKLLTNKTIDRGTYVEVYDDDNETLLGTFTWDNSAGTRGKFNEV